jgi:phosphate transport system permease protein
VNTIKTRIIKDRFFKSLVIGLSFSCAIPLVFIFFHIFKNGVSSMNLDFLINLPRPMGETGGGIINAITGTFILIICSSIMSVPLGVAAGIYLSEHRESRLSYWVTVCVEVLQGVPSIVLGIVAYLWIVIPTGGFSAFSGSIALGIMMLPVIVKATEETLNLIPESLKEASLALGVPYHRTILRVILPAGMNGIVTGILISVARIAGETAPLLFTAFGNPFMNVDVRKPVESLPHVIFEYAKSPYPEFHQLAWGASLILILLVLTLNIATRLVTAKWKVRF